jgi:hypothetical protein
MLTAGRARSSAASAEWRVSQQGARATGITEAELLLRVLASHEHARAEHTAVIGDEQLVRRLARDEDRRVEG